jgi:hypothetical protein
LNARLSEKGLKRLAGILGESGERPDPRRWAGRLVELRGEDGTVLSGILERFEGIPAQGAPGGEAYYEAELRYPLERTSKRLNIAPPAGADSEIGFVALHRGIPVCDLAPSANAMLWEARPAPEIAAKLKALGVESLVFSRAIA